MPTEVETVQFNLRIPTETRGHLETLARAAGMKLHPYITEVLWREVDRDLAETGRDTFMERLEEEHAAEVAMFSNRFDAIEQRQQQ